MPVNHTFVSPIEDAEDPDIVGPDEWNDGHIVNVDLRNEVSWILDIPNGGTGESIANDALNALLPDQAGNSGNFLSSDGQDASWVSTSNYLSQSFTSQTSVQVIHNFGTTPLVQVRDSIDEEFVSFKVKDDSDNAFTVTFSSPMTGKIIATYGGPGLFSAFGSLFFVGNSTETVITSTSTPVEIAGTSTAGNLKNFTKSGNGLIYSGGDTFIRVESRATIEVNNDLETDTIATYIYKNGVKETSTISQHTIAAVFQTPTSPEFVSVDNISVQNGDTITARIENQTDTTNITVTSFKIILNLS